jgi:predicted O-methyltransferase YrrM
MSHLQQNARLLKLNREIPGQMSRTDLEEVAFLASGVPPYGVIVETGSLLGLSAWHWSQNSEPSVQVFCIDPWERHRWIREKIERQMNTREFGVDLFREYVSDCENIHAIQGYSPDVAEDWDKPIDLYFEDSVHRNPILLKNIEFWEKFVKPGGVIAGHDFCEQWPDVKSEAKKLARRLKSTLHISGSVWWIRKP